MTGWGGLLLAALSMAHLGACGDHGGATVDGATGDVGPDAPAGIPDFTIDDADGAPAGVAAVPSSTVFYVSCSGSGKLFRGDVGTPGGGLTRVLDGTEGAGPSSSLAITKDGRLLSIGAAALGAGAGTPHAYLIDPVTRQVEPFELQGAPRDVAIDPVTGDAWITDLIAPTVYHVTLGATITVTPVTVPSVIHVDGSEDTTHQVPIYNSASAGGFLNLWGIAISADGKYALLQHLIDRHLFRFDLTTHVIDRLANGGEAPSGNGVALVDHRIYVAGGDESKVYVYDLPGDFAAASFVRKLSGAQLVDGLSEIAVSSDMLIVPHGASLGAPPGGGSGAPPDGGVMVPDAGAAAGPPFRVSLVALGA